MQAQTGLARYRCAPSTLASFSVRSFAHRNLSPNRGARPSAIPTLENLRSLQLKENAIIIIIITLKFVDFPGSVDLHNPVPLHFQEDKKEKDTPPSSCALAVLETYYYIPLNITTMRSFFLSSFTAGGNAAFGLSQIR